nr:RNA 2',3'-cyclic phosphodiesterase [Maritimibacter sp. DP1N21-5]
MPEPLITAVARLQAGLDVGRRVPEENLHLTLAFLGEVSEPLVNDVAEAMMSLSAPAVDLTLTGLDVMGGAEPSLVCATAEAVPALVTLQEKVMRMVRVAGVDLERRRFRPHVTLARFSRALNTKDDKALRDFLKLNGRYRSETHLATRVTLYESHLTKEGSIYDPLSDIYLRQP